LLGLLFDPQDGSETFLQIVSWLSLDCIALYPRGQNSSNCSYIFHNLKKKCGSSNISKNYMGGEDFYFLEHFHSSALHGDWYTTGCEPHKILPMNKHA
jgi:hypothetical protein